VGASFVTQAPLSPETPPLDARAPAPPPSPSLRNLTLHLIDVGEGDAILVQFPNGKTMLVDGGGREWGDEVVAYLRSAGVEELDVVVASLPDADHIGGLPEVFRAFEVDLYLSNGGAGDPQPDADLRAAVQAEGSRVLTLRAGDGIEIDPSLRVSVLSPSDPPLTGTRNDRKANSLVLLLDYGDVEILLTGDAEEETEHFLMRNPIDILKVGNHGSKYASSEAFLEAFSPEVFLLSAANVDRNGHPHPETLQRIAFHTQDFDLVPKGVVFCTCWKKEIVVTTDGADYAVVEGGTWPCSWGG
jgi:beta-lactamase superfamily II metal-dependent hydrolase